MYRNQLIQILKTFSRKEMTRFVEFVHSPYWNKHQYLRQLTDYFNRIYPQLTEKNCDRAVIFQALYPRQKHDQSQLALLFTYLRRLLEQFLVFEQFRQDELGHYPLLLSELRQRKQYRNYEKVMARFDEQLEKSSIKDNKYNHYQFLKASEADAYYTQLSRHQKDHSIQLKQDHLDYFYLALKLRDSCEMLIRSRILQIKYETGLLDTVLTKVSEDIEYYRSIPSIIIYYRIYQMITETNSDAFYEARKEVQRNISFFEREEQISLYNYLQNYCIERINKGDRSFLRESFHLSKDQLEQELLFEDGILSQWYYKNIVTTGIRLHEMEWTEHFIEYYKDYLPPEDVENAYTFNLASFYYSSNQLEKVLELLVRVEYNDIRYSLGAKSLLLRTYYDLDEYEALFSLSRSFTQYLHRNKLIPEARRRGMANLVRFTQRACQLKSELGFHSREKSRKELGKLATELEKPVTIIYRDWLDKKVEELEKELMD